MNSIRQTDVIIIGAGLAGSLTAAMLGRAGYDTVIADPRPVYRPDFRCEKIDVSQMRVLEKTGLADVVRQVTTFYGENRLARRGRIVEKVSVDQWGFRYDDLVNSLRAEISDSVECLWQKATTIENRSDGSIVTLASGEKVRTRIVVIANGLNFGLREQMGIKRRILSASHSTTLGFDVEAQAGNLRVPAITYFSDQRSEKMAYLTLFPIGSAMRANLFVYRQPGDPWFVQFKKAPVEMLREALPHLEELVGLFEIPGAINIRPTDLYISEPFNIPGVVLIGDAFSTSCPAAGTGTLKVFTDVERLCNEYLPHWLSTPGMGLEKISQFYSDPVKSQCEEFSINKAYNMRQLFTGDTVVDAIRRWIRYRGQICRGLLRQIHSRLIVREAGGTLRHPLN